MICWKAKVSVSGDSACGGHGILKNRVRSATAPLARGVDSEDVLCRLATLFVERGVPEHLRSDNGPEFTAKVVRESLSKVGVNTIFIEPGSPWENGYVESFDGKLRDELLNGETFYTLREAPVVIEAWRQEYNHVRPHSSLAYRPPAPRAVLPAEAACATLRLPLLAAGAIDRLTIGSGTTTGGRSDRSGQSRSRAQTAAHF
jgi:hypothetical protein